MQNNSSNLYKNNFITNLLLLIICLSLSGCYVTKQTGNLVKSEDIQKISIGMSSSELKKIIGAPNIIPHNSPNTWLYIFNKNSMILNKTPNIKEHKVVKIEFEEDKVTKIESLPYKPNFSIKFNTDDTLYHAKAHSPTKEFLKSLQQNPITPKL